MSFDYNYKFWVATKKELEDIFLRQDVFRRLKPIEDRNLSHYLYAELYCRYVQLVNKLGYLYHHSFQVQKRDVIKGLVETATQRVLELKTELKNLELSEFIYVDRTLIERKLTPDDITIWTPKYFPFWRPHNIQEIIDGPRKPIKDDDKYFGPNGPPPPPPAGEEGAAGGGEAAGGGAAGGATEQAPAAPPKPAMRMMMQTQEEVVVEDPVKKRLKEVVIVIQSHERARVGRKLLVNIKYNPAVFKPKMREDGLIVIKYRFTHKPHQTMLLPVKRTRFEANYFVQRRDLRSFNYYVKPVYLETGNTMLEDDMSDLDETEEEEESEEEVKVEEEEEGSGMFDVSEADRESLTAAAAEELIRRNRDMAALKIQCYWRAYRDRKKARVLVERRTLIYGMNQEFKPKSFRVKRYEERMAEAAKHRMIKEKYDEDLIKFCEDERARILRVRGPWIMEDISDGIRAWFREFYDKIGVFHPYPDELKGGTLLLLKGETMTPPELYHSMTTKISKEEQKKIRDKAKAAKKKEREKARKAKAQLMKQRAKFKAKGIIDMADDFTRSKAIVAIENILNDYKAKWADIDEKLNKKHEIIKEWITSDFFAEIHQELQLTVDELMRLEYELLGRALAKDTKTKYKPLKKPKPKKGKKGKKPPKDLTGNRSIESLYYELQDAGIIKNYPRKTFEYFIGERNHTGFDMLNIYMQDPPPFKGEMRDLLSEYILGMGPLNVPKPKGVLLAGPTHCGKQLLCDILATEIDAVVLDISPEKAVKYETDMKYFFHVIMKMAKLLQPTILFIRDVHRVFWKSVPAEFQSINPKLISAQLKKGILKAIKKEDKIFLLGTTDAPWAASGKMKGCFQKIILVPKTDYGTSFLLRRDITLQFASMPRDFKYFSALALLTKEYASGDVVKNIEETLNVTRRMQLVQRPLNPMEFIDYFLEQDPPQFPPLPKEWEKFQKWYKKVNKQLKKRQKMIKIKAEIMAKQAKLDAKKKK